VFALSPYWINNLMGIEWALGVLALFYAAVPWLSRVVRSAEAALVAFALTALAAVGGTLALVRLDPLGDPALWRDFLNISPLAQAPALMAGVAVFMFDRRAAGRRWERRARIIALAGGASVAALLATGLVPLPRVVLVLLFGVAFAAVVFGAMRLPLRRAPVRALAWLGGRTYGVYLFHLFVLGALLWAAARLTGLPDSLPMRVGLLPVVVAVSAVVAAVAERYAERPAVRWGERVGTGNG
jgi:peptidoglycan/LPS O-acetylase OafA/YrhL